MPKVDLDIEEVVLVFKLFGDRTRLAIMKLLETKQCCVCELTEAFDMSQPAISQHLRKLRDAKLVAEERRGQWVYYEINKQSDCYPLVQEVLDYIPAQTLLLEKMENARGC
ncbi:MAG TPA: metalloregulator ArsR/SmtB family transcription factor [Bacillota bacterium]|nr:metalloregulator ArsR/SmtB family transcription factor [Bacillota bacterium]